MGKNFYILGGEKVQKQQAAVLLKICWEFFKLILDYVIRSLGLCLTLNNNTSLNKKENQNGGI